MITWIDESCKAWGRCTRWILTDTNEGYPSMDTLRKAREGFMDASSRSLLTREYGEVRLATALEVARAVAQQPLLPEPLQATLWAQYVVCCRARERASAVSRYLHVTLSLPEYWRNVDRLHYFLAARLTQDVPHGTRLSQQFQQISA